MFAQCLTLIWPVTQAVFGKKHDSDLMFKKALTDGILLCR